VATHNTAPNIVPAVTTYSLEDIVTNGLCMGCGLCRSLFPEAIEAEYARDGLQRPKAVRPLTDQETFLLNATCPGIRVSYPELDVAPDHMWGPIRRIARGHSSDTAVRFKSASGGSLTALAIHILEAGKADFILHVRHDPDRPLLSLATRSYTREQVIAASGSRYTATAPLIEFAQILDEGRPFAIVAKPCDLTAVANLGRLDPRVDELCKYRLAMVCGGFSELSRFRDQLELWNIDESELTRFSFRGNGCPGPTAATTYDGRHEEITYWDFWGNEDTWRTFFRCKICPDAVGLSADIAVLDIWDDCNPTSENDGWNAVICRTARGESLLNEAETRGDFVIDMPWTISDLDRAQPHQTRKRRAVRARLGAMQTAGLPFPVCEDPGLTAISLDPMSDEFRNETDGTLKRLAKGAHTRND